MRPADGCAMDPASVASPTRVKHGAWLVEGGRAADSTSSDFVQVSPFAIFVRDKVTPPLFRSGVINLSYVSRSKAREGVSSISVGSLYSVLRATQERERAELSHFNDRVPVCRTDGCVSGRRTVRSKHHDESCAILRRSWRLPNRLPLR